MTADDFDWTACLARVRDRDEEAARTAVERLQDHVERIVRSHLPKQDEVEDLVQDVFLKVFHRLGQYRGQVPFEHWVSRIAVTTCIDRLRAWRVRPAIRWSDLGPDEQAAIGALEAAEAPDHPTDVHAWELLGQLLERLPPQDRLIIGWLDLEQRSIAEVSARTGWSSGVVRIRAFRARRRLKALFAGIQSRPRDAASGHS